MALIPGRATGNLRALLQHDAVVQGCYVGCMPVLQQLLVIPDDATQCC